MSKVRLLICNRAKSGECKPPICGCPHSEIHTEIFMWECKERLCPTFNNVSECILVKEVRV